MSAIVCSEHLRSCQESPRRWDRSCLGGGEQVGSQFPSDFSKKAPLLVDLRHSPLGVPVHVHREAAWRVHMCTGRLCGGVTCAQGGCMEGFT